MEEQCVDKNKNKKDDCSGTGTFSKWVYKYYKEFNAKSVEYSSNTVQEL